MPVPAFHSPSSTVTYLEINDGTNKEFCRVTAIGTNFTVVRGVLGTTARDWTLPVDASDEKGAKIKELIFVEGNSLELAYAIMTGDQIGLTGNLPDHWHLGMSSSLFDIAEFTGQEALTAYALGLKKTDGKKFIESEIMLPNSRYLRINGSGNLDLKRLHAIQDDAAIVATLDQTNIVKYGDLTFDSAATSNKFEIDWSYDILPKKAEYRRKSTFVFADSVTDYGEKLKAFKFRLVNGINATNSTLINAVNSFSDRFAGEAAKINISVLPTLNDIEVGDVVRVTHPSIQDFNAGSNIDRSMQVISTRVDQKKGTVDLELFGSTFAPDPLSDGALNVMNDSFYNATGTVLPNVTSNALTANTTLAGSADNTTSIWYHLGDLTINAGVTLTIQDNVQLRVRGHLTVLGDIDCADNGRPSGGGYIGSSRGADALHCFEQSGGELICSLDKGDINTGEFEAFPTLDLTNNAGNSISGVPVDLRGSAGGKGGDAFNTDNGELVEASVGGAGNSSGSSLMLVCRGMSLSGAGAVDMSGVAGNAATPSIPNGLATGGTGGFSTPGGLLVLLDAGTSSVPNLIGRITALSYQPNSSVGLDIKQNTARIQFIPQSRTAVVDEPIDDNAGGGNVAFKQAAAPTDIDCQNLYGRDLIQNDVWYDTDNSNFRYFYNGSTWDYLNYIQPWSDMLDDNGGLPFDNATATGLANLFANGNAELGTNKFFTQFIFDSTQNNSGNGSFSISSSSTTELGDQLIPVDITSTYEMSVAARSSEASDRIYLGLICYDKNGASVLYQGCHRIAGEDSTLFETAAAGQNQVKVVPGAAVWDTSNDYIQLNIETDYSDLPNRQSYRVDVVDTANPSYVLLTLGINLSAEALLGSKTGRSFAGATYTYCAVSNGSINNTGFLQFSGNVETVNGNTSPPGNNQFRIGTAFVGFMSLVNRDQAGTTFIDDITLNKMTQRLVSVEDGATVGADWTSNLISRPGELTDGRVGDTIIGSGSLVDLVTVDQGNGVNRNAALGLGEGLIRDGDAYTFPTAWDTIPTIKFAAGGLVKSGTLTGDHVQSFQASSISTTGFTAVLKLKELAGSLVSVTEITPTAAGTQDWEIDKTVSTSEAFDDTYTFQFDLTITNYDEPELGLLAATVNVGIYTNDGGGWVKRATVTLTSPSGVTSTVYTNQTKSVIVAGLTNHGGREFGINIESVSFGASTTLVFDNVKYTTASTPSDVTATPTGAPDVQFLVLGGG